MPTPLRVLMVEDDENDALLVVRQLERGGFQVVWERVETREAMCDALDRSSFDVIVSDYRMPAFAAPAALAVWKDRGLACPFLVVSGTIGEEQAVEILKAGAGDFFLKDRLSRLCSAVARELLEAERKRSLRCAEQQRQDALQRLQRSERLFQDLFASAPDATVIVEADGVIREVNRQAERLFGYHREELRGEGVEVLIPPSARPAYRQLRREFVAAPAPRLMGADSPNLLAVRKDGSVLPVEISLSPMTTEPGVIVATIRDISERRRLEERVRQAEKMEAIGRLAAGVAHDFNNILALILGHAQIMLRRIPADDPLRSRVEEIASAGDRAAALTRQLLAFSRKQAVETRVLKLNEVVVGFSRMLTRLVGDDVTLTHEPGPDPGLVRADPTQIEQILMNLAVNARDAMPDGGRLVIETSNVEVDEESARIRPGAVAGRYVCLAVTDTGHGMSREVQARAFEPFFTTKGPGQGTGLGLATVYGIVNQGGGFVSLDSEIGRGTTFKVYLPRVAAPAPVEAPSVYSPVSGGTETVLLVEDEASLREMIGEILEANGYTILAAADALGAIVAAERHPRGIDLLLTDVVMPGMSGGELARRIKTQHPAVRVLYMSGYEDAVLPHGVPDPPPLLISKPFTQELLARKLREALKS